MIVDTTVEPKNVMFPTDAKLKRAKALRKLKTYLGRTICDTSRRIAGQAELEASFKWPLYQASAVPQQRQRQRGRKIYSLHAYEVECTGKGQGACPLRVRL